MRKLSWLLIALVVALYTSHLWSTADSTAGYVVWDGLALAVVALLLFARNATTSGVGWRAPTLRFPQYQEQLTKTGGVLLGTGAICALVGALLPLLLDAPVATSTGLILRWLGLVLLAIVIVWPRVWHTAVRRSLAEGNGTSPSTSSPDVVATAPKISWLSLLLILLVGAGVRLLILSRLPSFCMGTECDLALALNGKLEATMPHLLLPQLLFRLTAEGLLSIRLGAMLLAMLILPLFYFFLRRLTGNSTAWLGTLLLALTPWFYTLDGDALPVLILLLGSCAGLWLLLEAQNRHQPRWALLSGVAFGLASGDALIQVALLFWLLLFVLVTLSPRSRQHLSHALLLLVGFLVVAPPFFLFSAAGFSSFGTAAAGALDGTSWLFALFQTGLPTDSSWVGVPLLAMPLGALAILGLGLYLRRMTEALYLWLASGLLLFALLSLATGSRASMALLFLLALVTAALALASLFATFYASWQGLVPLANSVAVVGLILLILAVGPLFTMITQGQNNRSIDQIALDSAMTEAVATLLEQNPDRTIFAPASLLETAGTRLRLGDEVLRHLRPLADLLNALYTTDDARERVYLIPAAAQPYVDLLTRLQPGAVVDRQIEPTSGELLFTTITVSQAEQQARQGLLGVAWETRDTGNRNPFMLPATDALMLPGTEVTLQPPYTMQWSGALRVATPGTYRIALETTLSDGTRSATAETQPLISLQLDGRLILDSSLGLLAQDVSLVKGFYQLSLLYRSPAAAVGTEEQSGPSPFAIRWQRPDGVEEIIPRSVLYNLPLPNLGLIGEYYWGESAQGEPFDVRKDLVVGLAAERSEPYNIRWRGQLAAPRTGEYLLAALSAPGSQSQLYLDGIQLFDTAKVDPNGAADSSLTAPAKTSVYAEGSIYLTRGWHELTVHYLPNPAEPIMSLFWQPPGSGPTPLDLSYLAPTLTPLLESDRPLPAAPPLANGAQDTPFALSVGTEFWQPQNQVPPGGLPQLAFEALWQIGSCGSADTQLDQPHGVAISGVRSLIYVADSANRRVVEYTMAGSVNRIYTDPDWQEPVAVALIDNGFPVLLDAGTQLLYDLNTTTGAVEQRPLQSSFYHPRGLAVDQNGNLLVADTGGGRVVLLTPAGEELRTIGGQGTQIGRGQPTAVAAGNALLWGVTAEDGRLWQLESGGSLVAIEHTNTINGPQLAALPDGRLLLTDPARRLVLYLAATGEPLAHFTMPMLQLPTGVAATTIDDLLYLAVVDSVSCQLSLWRTPLAMLPSP